MRKSLLLAGFYAMVSASALAQTAPFDMSPERPASPPPARPVPMQPMPQPAPQAVPQAPSVSPPATPPTVVPPAQQSSPPQPSLVPATPAQVPPVSPQPAPSQPQTLPQPQAQPAPAAPQPVQTSVDPRRRYILPFTELSLSGEIDQRQWTIYLTQQQAQAAQAITIAYQNAVVIAPESSNLEISINSVPLEKKSVASPDAEGSLSIPIPPGTLQAGANVVTLGVKQRHRTDCTIESTYALWTDINPAGTFITLNADVANRFETIEDIQAIGAGSEGLTSIDIVAPGLANPVMAESLLKLSQALALRTQMPNQEIAFHTAVPKERKAGSLIVLAGTSREIAAIASSVPPEVLAGPYAGFESNIVSNLSALIVGGPTPQALQTAIDSLAASAERPTGSLRSFLSTRNWHTPDAPLVFGDRRLSLSSLGVKSAEFSGRRFRTDFTIGIPADFYAAAYGEATLLLDAAYASDVLPGSHIDVYVNGNIASTVPVSNRGGGIFRHLPIKVTLRHFVPGANTVAIEAVMQTQADSDCLPGTTASATPRFALFDTSEFHMPNFARIGRAPDLAANRGVIQPYHASQQPVAVYMERIDPDVMSSAATLLGRMALAAGQPVAIDLVSSIAAVGDRDAVFIGTLAQIPPALAAQFNIAPASQTSWGEGGGRATPPAEQTDELFENWRERVDGGVWQGQISSFEEWIRRNFDISEETFRFLPGAEQVYTPPGNVNFMLAQGLSPGGEGVWTLATAPAIDTLRSGVKSMTELKRWTGLSGRIATYDPAADKVETIVAEQQTFFDTGPATFSNWRLIAANWLSSNTLSYALVFIGFLSLLGWVTFLLLRGLGRKP
ncbi:cellulose biosynthesis cyclic di-GMP-binding regulatory protein BcsB [Agrobacterium larrymoorei]|uniref:cellulose biosynthesis cyclic di-GMP-binding regulatory protein BcsB n=1 Tax=Agrobacterium larrymoorei TaxID=160699 RepID=UPI0030C2B1E1